MIALREIAANKINVDLLRKNLLADFRKNRHHHDDLNDNKQENYLELESNETNDFLSNFEEELAEGMSNIDITSEFDSEEMFFEDSEITDEDK